MDKGILKWEITGLLFILIIGSGLHFAFELSNFWKPVALVAAVNESTWEHLKMVFWPGLIFFSLQYSFLKNKCSFAQFLTAKSLCLFLMPLVIAVGWYAGVWLTGKNYFSVNIILFIGAILLGQVVSFFILTDKISWQFKPFPTVMMILLLVIAFSLFTYFPPKIFLFEHMDLENSGQYGILESYEGLLVFK
jgi:hypothetical protein